jgi:RNA polymerase sigma factor (sigma-70 family)
MSRIVEMYSNDDTIIEGIKRFDDEAVTRLYNRHKSYCISFMNSKYNDENTIQDIYQDAVIVFIEKVRTKNLELVNTSIQTYLNSICYNQIKVRFSSKSKPVLVGDDLDNQNNYNENINDWFNDINDIKNERMKFLQEELLTMQESGGKCYEILRLFYFEKKNMESIAKAMNYTNADNAKNQKSRCLDRLKTQVLKRK